MATAETDTRRHLDRAAAADRFRAGRLRTAGIFDVLAPEAYLERPIDLRNPIVFYEGHLPAFSVNTLLKKGLGEPGIDPRFEVLFERGIDPEDVAGVPGSPAGWPPREQIRVYGQRADAAIIDALRTKDVTREDRPVLARGLAAYTILEHEEMHQETLLYMWHRLPLEKKRAPAGIPRPLLGGQAPARATVRVPAGVATLGAKREEIPFGWDNEFDEHVVDVPAFEVDIYDVTNRDFLEFVREGGYDREELWSEEGWRWRVESDARHPVFWEQRGNDWNWRGMFEAYPLPPAWPVFVSHAEASAYARWRESRLPTEAEFHRAAYGTPDGDGGERSYPWGEEPPDRSRGNLDFARWDPVPVGSHPAGMSAWGVHDLLGNGWEWTSTIFGPFPGFQPMASYPVYSADFFDGKHWVMKGGSFATAKPLLRRSLRNWFRGNYPYPYATFRTVRD